MARLCAVVCGQLMHYPNALPSTQLVIGHWVHIDPYVG